MSAQPIQFDPPWSPDPVRQRLADHTIEDVLQLPERSPRIELVDGVMLVVPSPTLDHQDIVVLLAAWLRAHAPKRLHASLGVGVAVAPNHTYEPDVVLLQARPGGGGLHFFPPEEFVLVVEVVSKGTTKRDRLVKPAGYAAAGIPYYWRVEQSPVHVFAYRLGPDGHYIAQADSADVLRLDEPFPIALPISEITP
ncbi:MAG: Uma2 family endonuclease [Micromonosporaceae bacterium]